MANSSRRHWWTMDRRKVIKTSLCLAGVLTGIWILAPRVPSPWVTLSQIESSQLASATITELFGTSSYSNPITQGEKVSVLESTLRSVSGFVNPVQMFQSALLSAPPTTLPTGGQQSSLFQSIQDYQQQPQQPQQLIMGWIPYGNPTQTIRLIRENQGLTVASPEWLSVKNSAGDIVNRTESSVIDYAHQHNVRIYALVDNQFNSTLTHDVLTDSGARDHLVSNIVQAAVASHLDGLNIDFENLNPADASSFTAFIAQLHQALIGKNIVLSVDITPDIRFLKDDAAYFHAALAEYADYIVLMAYDEHWSSDQTPGPVADIPWVTTSINDLLDTGVPSDKLILGIPFYARFWHVHQDGSVDSLAVPISHVSSILAAHQATSAFDTHLGVSYAKYPKPDGYEEVWFSTPQTIRQELALVRRDGLKGVSIWSLSLSDPNNWSSLVQLVNMLS